MARRRKREAGERRRKSATPPQRIHYSHRYVVVARASTRMNRHAPRATRASLSLSLTLQFCTSPAIAQCCFCIACRIRYRREIESEHTSVNTSTPSFLRARRDSMRRFRDCTLCAECIDVHSAATSTVTSATYSRVAKGSL